MKKIYNFITFIFFYLFSFSMSFWAFWLPKVNDWIVNKTWNIRDTVVDVIVYILWFIWLIWVIFVIYWWFKILTAWWDDEKVKSWKKVILYALLWIFIILIANSLISWIYNWLDKNI